MSRLAMRVAVALMVGAATPAAASSQPPPPSPATARLQGQFRMAGYVTVAHNVRGEHTGQPVARTWTFTPSCPTGVCSTIGLVRRRAGGSDQLVLTLLSPGYYVGTGRFFAPLRCAGRTWRRGASVPFTIAVQVTGAALAGSDVLATAITATYTNPSRSNRTPCVAVLGHDAATYSGQLVPTPPPTGGVGRGGTGA
jgi:hypothetical protein